MELIGVSTEHFWTGETDKVMALFEAGLDIFHLRKPQSGVQVMQDFLQAIPSDYHHRIVLHQHHELVNEYSINRLHFKEQDRVLMDISRINEYKQQGFFLSTSVHDWETYHTLDEVWYYVFMGPVFKSISKENYFSTNDIIHSMPVQKHIPVIAIGGITSENIVQLKHFDGVAVFGYLWQNPQNSLTHFKKCQQIVHTY